MAELVVMCVAASIFAAEMAPCLTHAVIYLTSTSIDEIENLSSDPSIEWLRMHYPTLASQAPSHLPIVR